MDVLHSSMYLQWANPPASDRFFNYVKEKGFKKSFEKGTTILHEGEIVQHGYYIVEGWVALCFNNPAGDSRIASILGPKRPFGLAAALDQVPIPLSFKAIRDCEFYLVSRDILIQGMREDIDLNLEMIDSIFTRCKSAYQMINLSTYFPSEKKLVYFFITLLQYMEYREARDWYELPINLSHTQIAQLIGLSRVTVCNIFNQYRSEGKIRSSQQKLFVSNRLINDEYVKLFLET
ncbi:cyclic nucleotide-binding protein [Dehalobacter sp. MCB1]|uniref:Crp/Fnr family transcriptional regulator n=2 Tax=Dehalobacter TaxID=56112 RepID=UPI000E6B86DA|nr:Crp/Fnr family transcriptional regulator [Dehalobacter sp. 12DCB1]RJE48657.1 cyclic nucleotide-binding protein [Dehalobacter sp. MCB1]TCX53428.1 Crp/Fnr family transcriptional regulator [Dehalobacter sp. 14DCB1]TCX54443.1 Crp/Fnr family transcriptional regulator [Dehalobacter sp. 12DCB1]